MNNEYPLPERQGWKFGGLRNVVGRRHHPSLWLERFENRIRELSRMISRMVVPYGGLRSKRHRIGMNFGPPLKLA
jgi:hypothetical protein